VYVPTERRPMKAASLEELFERQKEEIVNDCTLCGACVEVCPVIQYTDLKSMSPVDIQESVIELLEEGKMSDVASIRASSCTHCGRCLDICPVGINPLDLLEILSFETARHGEKRYPLMEIKLGDRICLLSDILCSMQIKPGEERWITTVPVDPPKKDIVIFTGCALTMMPEKIFILDDIFKRLGLDFIILAGGEYCCGIRYMGASLEKADSYGKALIGALKAFNPRKVIYACAECFNRMALYDREILKIPFEQEEMFHFLSRHVDELGLDRPVNKTVTLHDPCVLARLMGDTDSLRRLLKAVPGINLVEMARNKEDSPCCGSATTRSFPKIARDMTRECLEEFVLTGAEVLVDACQGCHLQFCPEDPLYPFEARHCLSIIAEAMGLDYEAKLEKFYRETDTDKIVAECKENIEAGPFDLELVALLVKRFFRGPSIGQK